MPGQHRLEQAYAVLKARIEDRDARLVRIDELAVEPDLHAKLGQERAAADRIRSHPSPSTR